MERWAAIEAFESLSSREQVRFLLRLAWRLTVVARNYYVPQSDQLADPTAIREINELQHRVTAHALAVLDENPNRYPNDVLLDIILKDTPGRNELRERVHRAFAETYFEIRPEETKV